MNRRLSDGQARGILIAGVSLLAAALALALYSVPSELPGLPTFPIFSLPFPLLPLMIAVGTGFAALGGIYHSRGSLSQLLISSAAIVAAGLIWAVINFATAIPFDLGGITIHVEPYGAHATLVLAIGVLLAFFGFVFWGLERFERRREERLLERQTSTRD